MNLDWLVGTVWRRPSTPKKTVPSAARHVLPRQHPTDQCLDLGGCRVDQALALLRGWLNHRKNKVGRGHLSLRCNKNWREGGLASHLASSRPKATVAFSEDVGGLVLSRAKTSPSPTQWIGPEHPPVVSLLKGLAVGCFSELETHSTFRLRFP